MGITTNGVDYNAIQQTDDGVKYLGLTSYLGKDVNGTVTALNGGGSSTAGIGKVTFSELTEWLCNQSVAYFIGINSTNLEFEYVYPNGVSTINPQYFRESMVESPPGRKWSVLKSWDSKVYPSGDNELKVEVFLRKASDLSGNITHTFPNGVSIPDLDKDFIDAITDNTNSSNRRFLHLFLMVPKCGKQRGQQGQLIRVWHHLGIFSHGGGGRNALYYFNLNALRRVIITNLM